MKWYFQRFPAMVTATSLFIALLFFFSPVAAMDVSVTGNIQNWAFTSGRINENSTELVLRVTSANPSWHVNVKDALENGKNSSSAGRLLEYNTSTGWINMGSVIAGNMTVIGETIQPNIQGSEATLGPTEIQIESGNVAASNTEMNITLRQPITYTDEHLTNGNVYHIVISFLGYES